MIAERFFADSSELIFVVLFLLSPKSLVFWSGKVLMGKAFGFSCFLFPNPKKFKALFQKESSLLLGFTISSDKGSGGGN